MTVQKYGYRVGIDKNSSPDYQAKPNDRRWKQSFMEVCPVEKDPNISSSLKIEPGEPCFVVWAIYSRADSIQRDENGEVLVAGVFKNYISAQMLQKTLANHKKKEGNQIALDTPDGQSFDVYIGWMDYFDNLEEVKVSTTLMGVEDISVGFEIS